MMAALLLLNETLYQMLSYEKKALMVGALTYSPLFFVLVRFYQMLELRRRGQVKDWDWQDSLDDIDDEALRLRLRAVLAADKTLNGGDVAGDNWLESNGLASGG